MVLTPTVRTLKDIVVDATENCTTQLMGLQVRMVAYHMTRVVPLHELDLADPSCTFTTTTIG